MLLNAAEGKTRPPVRAATSGDATAGAQARDERIAVIVTAYNHARFLAEAVQSVLSQTLPAAEIVVVDDGSTDRPEDVLVSFPTVRMVKQVNRKVAAARNTGFRETDAPFLVFLDADDRLLPDALSLGLQAHRDTPGCGFAYGGFRRVDRDWRPISRDDFTPPGDQPHLAFFAGDIVRMPGTAMYRRSVLQQVGGFDETLSPCDDYEIYLRLSRAAPVTAHHHIIAEYRWHGGNISGNSMRMLPLSLVAQARYRPRVAGSELRLWKNGRRAITSYYVREAMAAGRRSVVGGRLGEGATLIGWSLLKSPGEAIRSIFRATGRRLGVAGACGIGRSR